MKTWGLMATLHLEFLPGGESVVSCHKRRLPRPEDATCCAKWLWGNQPRDCTYTTRVEVVQVCMFSWQVWHFRLKAIICVEKGYNINDKKMRPCYQLYCDEMNFTRKFHINFFIEFSWFFFIHQPNCPDSMVGFAWRLHADTCVQVCM